MAVGILALQGAFAEHAAVLDKLGVSHFEIRQKRDLDQPMNGLIIPGGESTVMNKLLRELDSEPAPVCICWLSRLMVAYHASV